LIMTNISREYLRNLTSAERKELAEKTAKHLTRKKLNPKTLWFIGEGKRDPGQELQIALEVASGGRVRPEDFLQERRMKKSA